MAMLLERVLTQNFSPKRKSFDLVNEWERQIKETLNCRFAIDFDISTTRKIPGIVSNLSKYFITKKNSLVFVMNPMFLGSKSANNRKNIIPWIIDFYPTKEELLKRFYAMYNKSSLVLISSKQVYDYLKSVRCPLNIAHLPLSLPDNMSICATTSFEKKYDVVLVGRQNPLLLEWLNKYKETHILSVVTLKKEKGHFNYYSNDGTFAGNADTRSGYISLLKKSRIGLYSTVGLDGDKRDKKALGFSQVTPRFLEYLATGNHILARYADNSDVDYYNLGAICPNLSNYLEFEQNMDKALSEPVNMSLYSDYLQNHYTSKRIYQLKEMLKTL